MSTFFTDRYTQSVKTTVRLYFTFLEVDKAVRSEGRPPLMATRQSSLLDYFTVDVVLLLLLPFYTFTLYKWARSQGTFEVGTSWGCQTKRNKRTEYRIRVFERKHCLKLQWWLYYSYCWFFDENYTSQITILLMESGSRN